MNDNEKEIRIITAAYHSMEIEVNELLSAGEGWYIRETFGFGDGFTQKLIIIMATDKDRGES